LAKRKNNFGREIYEVEVLSASSSNAKNFFWHTNWKSVIFDGSESGIL